MTQTHIGAAEASCKAKALAVSAPQYGTTSNRDKVEPPIRPGRTRRGFKPSGIRSRRRLPSSAPYLSRHLTCRTECSFAAILSKRTPVPCMPFISAAETKPKALCTIGPSAEGCGLGVRSNLFNVATIRFNMIAVNAHAGCKFGIGAAGELACSQASCLRTLSGLVQGRTRQHLGNERQRRLKESGFAEVKRVAPNLPQTHRHVGDPGQ